MEPACVLYVINIVLRNGGWVLSQDCRREPLQEGPIGSCIGHYDVSEVLRAIFQLHTNCPMVRKILH